MSVSDRPLVGIGWAILAMFSVSLLLALPKWAATDMPTIQITFIRYIAGVSVITPFYVAMAMRNRHRGLPMVQPISRSTLGWHVIRAVFAVTRLTCVFYAVTHMPFANAQAISLTNSVFMMIFAVLLLGETVRPVTIVAAALCFVGAVVAAEPQFEGGDFLSPGALAALAGAAIWGVESMVIKHTAYRDSIPGIIFIVNIIAGLLLAIPGIMVWQPLSNEQWIMLALMGTLAVVTQSANICAFRATQANLIAPFRYSSVIFALAIGWFVFNEWPSSWALFGMALILAGGVMLTRRLATDRGKAV